METTNYNKLNNILRSIAVHWGEPVVSDDRQTNRCRSGGFRIIEGRPYYNNGIKIFEIIQKREISELLDRLFLESSTVGGLGGVNSMYQFIRFHFLNITRKEVELWFKNQPEFQLTRAHRKAINKPIIANSCNQQWCIDLIDMGEIPGNNRQRYILSVIDTFSRRLWLEAMRLKEADQVLAAFRRVIARARIMPKTLLSDNGGEFMGVFHAFLVENRIAHIYTRSQTPTDNSLVESSNRIIRKIIRQLNVYFNDKVWAGDRLREVEKVKNATYNRILKDFPQDIWRPTHGIVNNDRRQTRVNQNLRRKATEKLERFRKNDNAQVGQSVRVKMALLFSDVRQKIKAGETKKMPVVYSPQIFEISQKINRNRLTSRNKYVLKNGDVELLNANGSRKLFFASEFMVVPADTRELMSNDEALALNGCTRSRTDMTNID